MPDIAPNTDVEKFRLEVKIEEMRLSVKKNRLRRMELEDSIRVIDANIEASEAEIARLNKEANNG